MEGGDDLSTFGKKPRAAVSPEMNVTPLVDVVLVLLIIFMVLAPVMSAHYEARLPPPDDKDKELQEEVEPDEPFVLRVEPGGLLKVGDISLDADPLAAQTRITRMLNTRPNTLIYLDASDKTLYGEVLQGLETAKLAGAKPIVFVTEEIPPSSGG